MEFCLRSVGQELGSLMLEDNSHLYSLCGRSDLQFPPLKVYAYLFIHLFIYHLFIADCILGTLFFNNQRRSLFSLIARFLGLLVSLSL